MSKYIYDTPTILIDTREKHTIKLEDRISWFQSKGCSVVRQALSYGDYTASLTKPDGEVVSLVNSVVIERKASLDELINCLTIDRDRFSRELQRAKDDGAKVYILVENASYNDVFRGRYHSKMTSSSLDASLSMLQAKFDVRIVWIDARHSAQLIYSILRAHMRDELIHGKDGKGK